MKCVKMGYCKRITIAHLFLKETIMYTDTIAAIATALSDSGIGIIRISGSDAIAIADKIYRTKSGLQKLTEFESHTIHYGYIIDSVSGDILDEVMVSVFKAPRSYTAEDTIEINCHGGVLLCKRILEEVCRAGARLAKPGEFSKRAFLNGRMDLTEAEAVMDLIHSKNEYALSSSMKQLRGSVSGLIREMRAEILHEIAFIESALDDPEHISLNGYSASLEERVDDLLKRLKKLLKSTEKGRMIQEGINTVIVGKPNAGKSSLLNLLVGEERAIVTNVAGTTRDVLEESISLRGIHLNIIDTAGIHSTEDVVEKIGVEKAKQYAENADLILYVVDASVPLDESDQEIMELIKDKKTVILLNKSDLDLVVKDEDFSSSAILMRTSAKENIGMEEFEEKVEELFLGGKISFNDQVMITNLRHKRALEDTVESLHLVKKSLEDGMPEDFYSIDLMSAYTSLGTIIGEEVGEDLVNEIFSKFCMGK